MGRRGLALAALCSLMAALALLVASRGGRPPSGPPGGSSPFVRRAAEGLEVRAPGVRLRVRSLRVERLRVGFWRTSLRDQARLEGVEADVYLAGASGGSRHGAPGGHARTRATSAQLPGVEGLLRALPGLRAVAHLEVVGLTVRLHRGGRTTTLRAGRATGHGGRVALRELELRWPTGEALLAGRALLEGGGLRLIGPWRVERGGRVIERGRAGAVDPLAEGWLEAREEVER